MRSACLTLVLPSLLAALAGCTSVRHTAGVCDCDPPPTYSTLYNYPGGTRPAVAAPAGAPAALPLPMGAPPLAPMPAAGPLGPSSLPTPPTPAH